MLELFDGALSAARWWEAEIFFHGAVEAKADEFLDIETGLGILHLPELRFGCRMLRHEELAAVLIGMEEVSNVPMRRA